ncbi:MAG: AraC family transcriptional regulator [Prevotellaceae bacterium]|jgi:AraC-like DNA-binding protein|nr:AraC family transcriptional regulator [Prevotellaceae bacterium]
MIELLYTREHLSCPNYDTAEHPTIEEKYMKKGESYQMLPRVNKVAFVLEGMVDYSTGSIRASTARRGHIFFLASNHFFKLQAVEVTHLLVVRLYDKIRLCDCWSVEDLYENGENLESVEQSTVLLDEDADIEPFLLEMNTVMEKYLELLLMCNRVGLRCRFYNESKQKELMFILRAFYPKDQLRLFFAPVLTSDARFAQQVVTYSGRFSTLADIAFAMNYTVSGFEKKFRKIFGCSPYNWMLRQRAQEIWHSVKTEEVNLKEISKKFGFSSASSFNNFFVKHFGITPGEARQNRRNYLKKQKW